MMVVMLIADSLVTAVQGAVTQCQAGHLQHVHITLQMAIVVQGGRDPCAASQLVGFFLS